jgi:RND family efflux transporter MFP subunit
MKKRTSNGQSGRWRALLLSPLLLLAGGCGGSAPATKPEKAVPVRLATVERRTFEDRVEVDGTIQAKTTALVSSRVPGVIEQLFVKEGSFVEAGQTRLFAVDQLKLEKAVEVAQQALAVARLGRDEKQANLERIEAVLNKAQIDYERQKKLFEEEQIGTRDQIEQLESAYRQARAGVKHAKTLVALAEEQVRQAAATLAMAEKDLRDAVVIAPISGVVSRRFQDVGDMGSPDQPVFQLDDTNALEVSVFLPARHYGRVQEGKTPMRVTIEGRELGTFPVRYKSPTIDPALRVFEVKCDVGPARDDVVPGQLVSVRLVLATREGLAAPREAVGRRGARRVVYQVRAGKAHLVPVTPGWENDGWVEVRAEGLAPGDQVVTEGRFLLDDGTAVQVLKEKS